jgi:hypothetical protein
MLTKLWSSRHRERGIAKSRYTPAEGWLASDEQARNEETTDTPLCVGHNVFSKFHTFSLYSKHPWFP